MGGRYTLIHLDEFCRKQGIRMLTVDRPGMGGSQHIPLQHRISTWLATFESLLTHLNISDVSIASHSGGAIYATNTLIHHRKYVHPDVAFFAPFCHSSDSGSMTPTTAILRLLPGPAIAQFDKLARGINSFSGAMGWSSGFVKPDIVPLKSQSINEDGDVHMEWWAKASKYMFSCVVAEDISGSSDEAVLYLRKGDPPVPWGEWQTYDEAANLVAEESRRTGSCLRIAAFHADADHLVGRKGGIYFDRCWRSAVRDGDEIQHSSEICPGTNHDSILAPDQLPMKRWLKSLVDT